MSDQLQIKLDKEYSVKEVAQFLEVLPQTVSTYLRQGSLKGQKKGPKNKWYVPGEEVIKVRKKWNMDH